MAEREPVLVDGQIVTDLAGAIGQAVARRGLTAAPGPAAGSGRYSENTATREEFTEILINEGLRAMRQHADGEFDPDRLPPLHEFTAEWVQQHLRDPHEAPFLILVGPVGCGKTSQSFATVRTLIIEYARRHMRHLDWRFVTNRNFGAMIQKGGDEDAEIVFRRYAHAQDLLIFSDLGDFNAQDFGRTVDFMARLINHRWHHKLPTIFETNLLYDRSPDVVKMEETLGISIDTLDRHLDDRAIDRLKSGWTAPLPEINYRRAKGRVMGA